MSSIYLDYNATAPLRPQVRARIAEILELPANASSSHSFGRMAKKYLEDARKTIAEAISAFPNEIIFVSCGSEANAMALRGFPDRRVLVSSVEHSSVLKNADLLIPVISEGIIDLVALDALLVQTPNALVSVMLANNETGVLQPIREVAEMCKKYGALLHCDAVQVLGKIPVDFTGLGVDMMTIAAHKMGGPVGAAALVVRQNLGIMPLLLGGGQELRRRAGTENIAAISGFARATELIDLTQMRHLRGWLDSMERIIVDSGASIFGQTSPRLPNTSCLAIGNLTQEVMLMKLDLMGFAVSAGSACSSGRIEPSHVLQAMGIDALSAARAIRISGGWDTTQEDINKITKSLLSAAN